MTQNYKSKTKSPLRQLCVPGKYVPRCLWQQECQDIFNPLEPRHEVSSKALKGSMLSRTAIKAIQTSSTRIINLKYEGIITSVRFLHVESGSQFPKKLQTAQSFFGRGVAYQV